MIGNRVDAKPTTRSETRKGRVAARRMQRLKECALKKATKITAAKEAAAQILHYSLVKDEEAARQALAASLVMPPTPEVVVVVEEKKCQS